MSGTVSPAQLHAMQLDGAELALLDVREEGAFFHSHLLWAVNLPLSRLELKIADLVPRRDVRTVLCDAGDGLAERAAVRLAELGWRDASILAGGTPAWGAAGYELFSGMNVPTKAFGEFVEHAYHTPSISAEELKAMMEGGEKLVVLDSRPMDEYEVMNIPSGVCCPGAELVYRVGTVAPSPDTTIVVNCAGRTRSIIGAQSLINAGIPNKVVALRNGTMGWHLAGLELETGNRRHAPEPTGEARAGAEAAAAAVAERFGVRRIDAATLADWRGHAGRTTFLLDVRSPEEYAAGHLPGAICAPGGQLVQATDRYVGVRNARLVLADDTGVRATMTAHWLLQIGWEVYVLGGGLPDAGLERGAQPQHHVGMEPVEEIVPGEAAALLERGAAEALDLADSRTYRKAHIPGALWGVRSRLEKLLAATTGNGMLVVTSPDGLVARLAAADLGRMTDRSVRVVAGGTEAWQAAGLPTTEGRERMADTADDVALRPYDREDGIEDAMREYLSWEVELVRQIEREGTVRFRSVPPA
ncbi:MAG: rhodanese-like domain-containing protein [Alphaproteobacteria bacterium]